VRLNFHRKLAGVILVILILTALSLNLISFVASEQFYRAFLEHGADPISLGIDLSNGITTLNVNGEHNLPTWFSSSLLLLCAVVLAAITYAKNQLGERYVRHWGALSVIFACLSVDEAIGIHELANRSLRSLLQTSGLLYYAWVIPAAVLVLVFVVVFLRFVFYLPMRFRLLFVAAGAIYVGGGLGLEMVGAFVDYSHGSQSSLLYAAQTSVEEFLEMTGSALFLYSLMLYTGQLEEGSWQKQGLHEDEKTPQALW
jgi:hypothetical protein